MVAIDKNNGLPLQYQLRKSLEAYICRECKPGDRLFSERELAERFSVARGTISRVIDRLLHEGLLVKVQGRGTFVAQTPQANRTIPMAIGLVLPFSDSEGGGGIMQGVAEVAHEHGYEVIFAASMAQFEKEITHINRLRKIVDGIIFYPHGEKKTYLNLVNYLESISREKFPLVLIDKHFEGIPLPYVETDNREASYRPTIHLAERGHTNIAHMTMRSWDIMSSLTARRDGYLKAVQERSLPSYFFHVSEKTMKAPVRTFLRFIEDNHITAISAANNLYYSFMLEAIMAKRLPLPALEIAGVEDVPFPDGEPVMTVIQQKKEIGRESCKMLFNLLENKTTDRFYRLKPMYTVGNKGGKAYSVK